VKLTQAWLNSYRQNKKSLQDVLSRVSPVTEAINLLSQTTVPYFISIRRSDVDIRSEGAFFNAVVSVSSRP
jgi:hypothetical protein